MPFSDENKLIISGRGLALSHLCEFCPDPLISTLANLNMKLLKLHVAF